MTTTYESNRPSDLLPFFSICIPQYNRTDFLIEACSTFARQSFSDFELCISDDCSNDGKESTLLEYLRAAGVIYTYSRSPNNIRYDSNLRRAIDLSAGRYLILMGNDDGLSDAAVLQDLQDALRREEPVAVAITNYREVASGVTFRRMTSTGVIGSGPEVAVATFRRYSFVSGIVMSGNAARRIATDVVDGSEMYQMYLGTRLVATGGRFLAIDRVCVDKDLQVAGQAVDSYARKPRLRSCPIVERPLPMGRLLEVVAAGLESSHDGTVREKNLVTAALQLYRFTYPYWIVEYRRIQSWKFALGVLLALRPVRITAGLGFSALGRTRLWLAYAFSSVVALSVPIRIFDRLLPKLYALAKRH